MKTKDLNKMSNGFLDTIRIFCVTNYQNGFIKLGINDKIYSYSLYEYKNAFDKLSGNKGRQLYHFEYLDYLDEHFSTDKKVADMEPYLKQIKEKERERNLLNSLLKEYAAEYENACDDLYYGYGYNFWRTHNNSIDDDDIAEKVWKAAFKKMSKS